MHLVAHTYSTAQHKYEAHAARILAGDEQPTDLFGELSKDGITPVLMDGNNNRAYYYTDAFSVLPITTDAGADIGTEPVLFRVR
jgi:hypothetical protein